MDFVIASPSNPVLTLTAKAIFGYFLTSSTILFKFLFQKFFCLVSFNASMAISTRQFTFLPASLFSHTYLFMDVPAAIHMPFSASFHVLSPETAHHNSQRSKPLPPMNTSFTSAEIGSMARVDVDRSTTRYLWGWKVSSIFQDLFSNQKVLLFSSEIMVSCILVKF